MKAIKRSDEVKPGLNHTREMKAAVRRQGEGRDEGRAKAARRTIGAKVERGLRKEARINSIVRVGIKKAENKLETSHGPTDGRT